MPYANLVEVFEDACQRYPHRDALGSRRDGEWTFTQYAHLHALVDQCRGGLVALGVGSGDRVAVIGDDRLEWAVAAFATYGLGAVLVPMRGRQSSEDLEHVLADTTPAVVFTSGDDATITARRFLRARPEPGHVVGFDLPPEDEHGFRHLLGVGVDAPTPARIPDAKSAACIAYTRGTTGPPRGAVLTHGGLVANLEGLNEVFPLGPGARLLSLWPWGHAFGLSCGLHFGLSQGASILMRGPAMRSERRLDVVAAAEPTALVADPGLFEEIRALIEAQLANAPTPIRKIFEDGLAAARKHREGENDSWLHEIELKLDERLVFAPVRERLGGALELVLSLGTTLDRERSELADTLGLPLYEAYGSTEAGPLVTANTPRHRRLGSAGAALPGVRVAIEPETGEILVYGPGVMREYHGRPDATRAAFTDDGGLRTGDVGRLDGERFLYVQRRLERPRTRTRAAP